MMNLYKAYDGWDSDIEQYAEEATTKDVQKWLAERRMVAVPVALLADISSMCIGELTMSYRLDAQLIGEMIYKETGLTAHGLYKAAQEPTE